MKKNFLAVSILVVTALLLTSCGMSVSFPEKYLGEKGKSDTWICQDGRTEKFDHRVASAAAEIKCSSIVMENTDSCNDNSEEKEDPCLIKADSLDFPKDLAEYVCQGTYGGGASLQLPSEEEVPFGTITVDKAVNVWILTDYVVPNWANYSFSYDGSEKNIFEAAFLNGKKECFNLQTGLRTEICNVCFNTTDPGCEIDVEFFDN